MNPYISLARWRADMTLMIARFAELHERMATKCSENYPLERTRDDWDDQFYLWISEDF